MAPVPKNSSTRALACASRAIEIVEQYPEHQLRVEGNDDVVDVEVLDADGHLVSAHQMKSHSGVPWTPKPIADVLRRWIRINEPGPPVSYPCSSPEVFAGHDHTQYEAEVRERWGDEARVRSAQRRGQLSADQRRADDDRSLDVNAALRDAAASGLDPAAASLQSLVTTHHRWLTDHWGGRTPVHDAYTGVSELYVADERFAAT